MDDALSGLPSELLTVIDRVCRHVLAGRGPCAGVRKSSIRRCDECAHWPRVGGIQPLEVAEVHRKVITENAQVSDDLFWYAPPRVDNCCQKTHGEMEK